MFLHSSRSCSEKYYILWISSGDTPIHGVDFNSGLIECGKPMRTRVYWLELEEVGLIENKQEVFSPRFYIFL